MGLAGPEWSMIQKKKKKKKKLQFPATTLDEEAMTCVYDAFSNSRATNNDHSSALLPPLSRRLMDGAQLAF